MDHPSVAVLRDRFVDAPSSHQIGTTMILAYFGNLPLSEANNPVSPGHTKNGWRDTQDVYSMSSTLSNSRNEAERRIKYNSDKELYDELHQELIESGRGALLEHPVFRVLEDHLDPEIRGQISRVNKVLTYFNTLSPDEAENPVFPGHVSGREFIGADENLTAVLSGLLITAQHEIINSHENSEDKVGAKFVEMTASPDHNNQKSNEEFKEGRGQFVDEAGLKKIAQLHRNFIEYDVINPYQLGLVISSIIGALEKTYNTMGWDKKAVSVLDNIDIEGKIFAIDEDISIAEIVAVNELSAGQAEILRADIQRFLAKGSIACEASDLMDNDGFILWALSSLSKMGSLDDDNQLLLWTMAYMGSAGDFSETIGAENETIMIDMLSKAPGFSLERAQYFVGNIKITSQMSEVIEAAEMGMSVEQYEGINEDKPAAYALSQYTARFHDGNLMPNDPLYASQGGAEQGAVENRAEVDTPTALANQTPLSFPSLDGSDDLHLRWPILSGVRQNGEHVSTGLYTSPEGDGVRLGVSYGERATLEAFNHLKLGAGTVLDFGSISLERGDMDGVIRTPVPGRSEHYDTHNNVAALRILDERVWGEWNVDSQVFAGIDVDDGDPALSLRSIFEKSHDGTTYRTGGSVSYVDQYFRGGAFGEFAVDMPSVAGGDSSWIAGLQGTFSDAANLGNSNSRALGTVYTEYMLSAGETESWLSNNISGVFGAHASTEGIQGLYVELLKGVEVPGVLNGSLGVRVGTDNEHGEYTAFSFTKSF